MSTTLYNLVMSVDTSEVRGLFIKMGADDGLCIQDTYAMVNNHMDVLENLTTKIPVASDIIITVEDDGDVCCIDDTKKKGEERWTMSSYSWAECLGMVIHPDAFTYHSPAMVLTHSLYEICWHGYTEEKAKEFFDALLGYEKDSGGTSSDVPEFRGNVLN